MIEQKPRRATLRLVRYHSPFGTPMWMDTSVAERRLDADLKVWNREQEEGTLTTRQLEHGPPRIER